MRKILLLILLLISSVANATTYYVRMDGNDTYCQGLFDRAGSGTSTSCAFRGLQTAIGHATNPGDIVIVHAGDYRPDIYLGIYTGSGSSGTAGSPITIKAYKSGGVYESVILGKFYTNGDYIRVEGLSFTMGWPPLLVVGKNNGAASNNEIVNNYFYGGAQGNPGTTAIEVYGSDNLVQGNTIEGPCIDIGTHTASGSTTLTDSTKSWEVDTLVGQPIITYSGSTGQITANTATSATVSWDTTPHTMSTGEFYEIGKTFFRVFWIHDGSGNTVKGNVVRNLCDCERILEFDGDSFTFSGNEIHSIKWNFNDSGSWTHADVIQVWGASTTKDFLMENNYIHDVQGTAGFIESSYTPSYVTGWQIRGNIFANVEAYFKATPWGTLVANNTFFNLQKPGPGPTGYIDGLGVYGLPITDPVIFRNNVIIEWSGNYESTFGGMISIPISVPDGKVIFDHNFYSTSMDDGYQARNTTNPLYAGNGNINGGDPKFTAVYNDCVANSCNFKPIVGSPLIAAGTSLAETWADAKDYNGILWGDMWGIGAIKNAPPNLLGVPRVGNSRFTAIIH